MPTDKIRDRQLHFSYLDAARGIAALMVMAYHYLNWNYGGRMEAKIMSILFNGSDAVSFFFVLSGFVLSFKYIHAAQPLDIGKFYINRVFRLWPAFFVVVVCNALNWSRDQFTVAEMGRVFLHNKTGFWEEALLLRSHPHYFTPGWTLVIELAISFFVPFMIVLARYNTRLMYWLLFAFLFIGGNMGDYYMFHFHFCLGIVLSCLYGQLTDPSFRETRWYRWRGVLLLGAIVLFSVRHIDRILPLGPSYTALAKYLGVDFFHYTGLASFIFLAFIIQNERAKKMLGYKVPVFLGKISYGIYLVHWLFVTDIFVYWGRIAPHFGSQRAAFILVFLLYALATILSATLLHYLVELPFIRLGKKLTSRLRPTFVIR